MIKKDFVNSIVLYSIPIILNNLIPFITLPIITNSISNVEYGIYGSLLSICTIFISFVALNLGGAIFKFYDYNSNNNSKLISTSFFFSTFSIIILSLCSLLFVNIQFGLIIYIYILIFSFYQFFVYLIRVQNKVFIYLKSEVIKQLIFLLFLLVSKYLGIISAKILFFCFIVSSLISLLFLLYKTHYLIDKNSISFKMLKDLLIFSLPTVPVVFINSFFIQSPIFFFNQHFPVSQLGDIVLSNRLSQVLLIFQTILFLSWPYFAYKFKNQQFYQGVFDVLVIVLLLFIIVNIYALPFFITILTNSSFVGAYPYTIKLFVSISLFILGNYIDTSAGVSNKTWLTMICAFINIFTLFVFIYILTPIFQVDGIFLGVFLSSLFNFIIKIILYNKYTEYKAYTITGIFIFFTFSILTFILPIKYNYYLFIYLFIIPLFFYKQLKKIIYILKLSK